MSDSNGTYTIFWICFWAIALLEIIGAWKIFTKAGRPGWASIIPIYNAFVTCDIAGKEWWWVILLLVPVINILAIFVIAIALAEQFGKSWLYGVGLVLLGFIFVPLLGFGDATYTPAQGH